MEKNKAISYDVQGLILIDETDKYSEIIKNKIERYEQLVNRKKRTETEEDQMKDLKKYMESIPGSLAPELKVKFQQIELNRIGKQDD
jgi:hypothetical protein